LSKKGGQNPTRENRLCGPIKVENSFTKIQAVVEFSFPEFTRKKTNSWICLVDDKNPPERTSYDMIIAMEIISYLGYI
jgi:hypothetical protein